MPEWTLFTMIIGGNHDGYLYSEPKTDLDMKPKANQISLYFNRYPHDQVNKEYCKRDYYLQCLKVGNNRFWFYCKERDITSATKPELEAIYKRLYDHYAERNYL